jgi:hypothetical protein
MSSFSGEEILFLKSQPSVSLPNLVAEVMKRKLLRRTRRQQGELSLKDLDNIEKRASSVSRHRRRTLTAQLLQEPGPVMRFNRRDVPLFTEACGLPAEPLPDVDEVVRDHRTNPIAVETHVRTIIDRIIQLTPQLANRLLQQDGLVDGDQAT